MINGERQSDTLFALIKKTSQKNPNRLVSAYKDNVAFVLGPKIQQFAPQSQVFEQIHNQAPWPVLSGHLIESLREYFVAPDLAWSTFHLTPEYHTRK